jgi:hypothetical protein
MTPYPTRRRFLKSSGAAVAALAVGTGAAVADEDGWTVAETPTGGTLYDVARTANGIYAVGTGGVVLRRDAAGWTTMLDGGPTGNGNDLYGVDVTDDGEALWFVGASGAIGEYDVETGNIEDYSAPMDVTNNFNDVSVRTTSEGTTVSVAGDSGGIYYSFDGDKRAPVTTRRPGAAPASTPSTSSVAARATPSTGTRPSPGRTTAVPTRGSASPTPTATSWGRFGRLRRRDRRRRGRYRPGVGRREVGSHGPGRRTAAGRRGRRRRVHGWRRRCHLPP